MMMQQQQQQQPLFQSARYGADSRWKDVTDGVRAKGPSFAFSNGEFDAQFGDPAFGTVKQLEITLMDGSKRTFPPGQVNIPMPQQSYGSQQPMQQQGGW